MAIFPTYIKTGQIKDGSLVHILPYCLDKCKKDKCQRYYDTLMGKPTGSYRCPYGLSSYIYNEKGISTIFTGIRIQGIYDKSKSKLISSENKIFNPVLDEKDCIASIKEWIMHEENGKNIQLRYNEIDDLLHETRTLNGQSKTIIDLLFDSYKNGEEADNEKLLKALKDIHVISYMISNRFAYFDSVINPELTTKTSICANIFKKFDKLRKLFTGYLRKNVHITLESPQQCEYRYKIYPTFETLIFILLENAIKYSPEPGEINIKLLEKGCILDATIQSVGPYCDENEILHLCDKGFRGTNAKSISAKGQGFGLNFAKEICEIHKISMSFDSTYSHQNHGIKYGRFLVNLHFDNEKD